MTQPNAPLFRDPIYDGAADPTVIWNRQEQCWWLLYTNRRANVDLPWTQLGAWDRHRRGLIGRRRAKLALPRHPGGTGLRERRTRLPSGSPDHVGPGAGDIAMPWFFFLGLTLILIHEMDAVHCREWRIFPLLYQLDDKTGYLVFTWAHVPLYLLLFWGLFGAGGLDRGVMRAGCVFIVHAALHLLFLRHPKNEFKSITSWAMILGERWQG
ncbi:MAG: DUF6713 family protein [Caldilineaceae bacterium]